jgi:hypothetical protein
MVFLKILIYLLVHMLLMKQLNQHFVLQEFQLDKFDHNDLDEYHEQQN